MRTRKNIMIAVLISAPLLVAGIVIKSSFGQDTASVPKTQDDIAIGEDNAKQLMLLIGPNKDGKITKKAWMKFMAAEFDRLDKDKSGTLDPKELVESRLRVNPFSSLGK